ncbi:exosortase K [Leptospira perolatii]|uniref:Exosortase K n=1 Tax=Leptospira perolatii TaxID=2023191 RepID=A0A2M9ZSG7_9LEPT|nr:exosortase K [Leptospira perolatii]PJZ71503.1 exosortase K [Leptospira perolatii]PJZ75037.1 exosortase K [Leptospira perolatii]
MLGLVSRLLAIVSLVFLKFFTRDARTADLDFILSPTVFLTELMSSRRFAQDTTLGYIDWTGNILIDKSCSGMNFLVLSAILPILFRKSEDWWIFCAIAYPITIIANSIRITGAIFLQSFANDPVFHTMHGSFVYLSILIGFYLCIIGFKRKESIPQ